MTRDAVTSRLIDSDSTTRGVACASATPATSSSITGPTKRQCSRSTCRVPGLPTPVTTSATRFGMTPGRHPLCRPVAIL
jgi:hypothetical protein